jgi:hypothetical protein
MFKWGSSILASTWYDWNYVIGFIPALLVSIWAQIYSYISFKRYANVHPTNKITAEELARKIMVYYKIKTIPIKKVEGEHTNHYNPRKDALYLSASVMNSASIPALGISAHEASHAVQYNRAKSGFYLKLRNIFLFIVNFISNLAFPVYIIGFITWNPFVMKLGAWMFTGVMLFHLATLPVEINSNKKALEVLENKRMFDDSEMSKLKSILIACSIYYISSALTSIFHLGKLLFLSHREID